MKTKMEELIFSDKKTAKQGDMFGGSRSLNKNRNFRRELHFDEENYEFLDNLLKRKATSTTEKFCIWSLVVDRNI